MSPDTATVYVPLPKPLRHGHGGGDTVRSLDTSAAETTIGDLGTETTVVIWVSNDAPVGNATRAGCLNRRRRKRWLFETLLQLS